eukprot:NODE_16_length_5592_cov_268.649479_g13_i0.p1 GENE.NODE_16_length_5592_cov_268.649479_g13_i0~~NODE_16_length_5592_cov_268.649479_g13_i0.p1  ORF type:complete len:1810 (-),score=446.90 NODE_16_length_5592_cov_268.649479_g13_i0:99-5528(-)
MAIRRGVAQRSAKLAENATRRTITTSSKSLEPKENEIPKVPKRSISTATKEAFKEPHGTPLEIDRSPNPDSQFYQSVDGSHATAHVAYHLSDTAFIYPITPSSVMGELSDVWMAQKKKNVFGQVVDVREMQSEAGAAGAVHGALVAGSLCTTFTASQGLLLMIPNMYKIAGELLPCVIHVSAREVAGQALSIFGGHGDVMAVKQTGFAMLSSHTVQEAHDMALVSHVATLKTSVPFVHFFDGFRTSHEVNKIKLLPPAEMLKLIPFEAVQLHWSRSLNPSHPTIRGTNQGPDIFFQNVERANPFYTDLPDIVQETMNDVAKYIGRQYKLFSYVGAADATDVVILMGSGSTTVQEAVSCLQSQGKKVGALLVHLYRPWSAKHFLAALPKTTKRIAVLDRVKEVAAVGEPLYVDVSTTLRENAMNDLFVIGGRYGLGSKDFVPEHALAVFTHLAKQGHNRFTVGIRDDMTHSSIPYWEEPRVDTVPEGTRQCVFWGIGSDGTVGANRSAVKIIGDNTKLMAQAYFSFDAFKSGGVTSSHLRFGPVPITSQYLVTNADYIACHFAEYARKLPMLNIIKEGGVFVLNSRWTIEEMEKELPAEFRRLLVQRKVKFYNVDARKICTNIGLGKRINMLMQAVFFKLSGVLPEDQASALLKKSIEHEYGKKGKKVVEMNQKAVDVAFQGGNDIIQEVQVPAHWANAQDGPAPPSTGHDFVDKIMRPMMGFRGQDLPVSALTPGGVFPVGTTQYAKRAIAASVPVWKPNNCTQCNYCSFVCPHAVIRPFVCTDSELEKAPGTYETRKAKGDFAGFNYRIQIAPKDCTGCEVCVNVCPDDALAMIPLQKSLDSGDEKNWDFAISLPERGNMTDRASVKGSQFQKPLLEFSGACEGCGETPYVKLLTQLFGERMMIANATGCSSIWGGTAGLAPYTTNHKGQGPAWGNSLFEDNAEYGFGMAVATAQRRSRVATLAQEVLDKKLGDNNVQKLLGQWLRDRFVGDKTAKYIDQLVDALDANKSIPEIGRIYDEKDMLPNISQWIIGGDGWANDIGFGGLDHVLASGQNLNVLVLDTEMYSNTGGQASKSSHLGSVSKFALGGKKSCKKALGEMAMSYGNVYVASVSHGNMAHCVKAMLEAESYPGASLIMCYAPCIEHGLRTGMTKMVQEAEAAIDCGYWPLYRFDPRLSAEGKNPFQLDSKRIKGEVLDFLKRENRFINLEKNNPKEVTALRGQLDTFIKARFNKYKRMTESHKETVSVSSGPKVTILYGSETGHSESLSKEMAVDFERREYAVSVQALDDIDISELPDMGFVVINISTCGQGAFPKNSLLFWQELQKDHPADWLKNLKYTVFGLGDSTYYFFCQTAKLIDARLAALGAQRVVPLGLGDDGDEDKYETGFNNWVPSLWTQLGTKTPELTLFEPSINVNITPTAIPSDFHWSGSTPISSKQGAVRITPQDYGRNFVTIEWKSEMPYRIGDSLGIYPENTREAVREFLLWYGQDPKTVITIENKGTRELPEVITVEELFVKVVDIFGKPSRRFYQTLSHFATNPKEKERLLAMGEGKGEFVDFLSETRHYADALKIFTSAKPPLHYLIEMVPNIKPRYYSISSSPKSTPGEVHSLVLIDTWTTPSGLFRTGLTCTMLEKLTSDRVVDACIHPTAMEFPEDTAPLVMAGIGSGLAPFVAFLRERSWKRKQGIKVGNLALYFGNRYEKKEYLMEKELKQYVDEGLLSLRTAFSRDDPKKKVYVQDIVRQDPELLYDYLVKQKGSMYVCGSREMPKPVQNSLKHCFIKGGGMTEKEADDYLVEMFTTGRYNIESW